MEIVADHHDGGDRQRRGARGEHHEQQFAAHVTKVDHRRGSGSIDLLGDSEQAGIQPQLTLLGGVERDFEADALLIERKVDDAAIRQRAFRLGNREDRPVARAGEKLRQAASFFPGDEEDLEAVERVSARESPDVDRAIADGSVRRDLCELACKVVGADDADCDRRGTARRAIRPLDVARKLVEKRSLDGALGDPRSASCAKLSAMPRAHSHSTAV